MLAVIADSGFPGEVLAQFQKREIICRAANAYIVE